MKRAFLLLTLALMSVFVLTSCGSDDSDDNVLKKGKLTVKVQVSDNAEITGIVCVINSKDTQSLTNVEGTTWTKEFDDISMFSVSVSGWTTDKKSGWLKVDLIRDDKVVGHGESEGTVLVANVSL